MSRQAGEPWRDKLLVLPAFLTDDDDEGPAPSLADLRDGFALTGFFLARHVYDPRGEPMPAARYHFITAAVGEG